MAELRRPEGPPSGAPYLYREEKETHELTGGRGQLRLRSSAIARPMILAIMTSLVSRPVKFLWPLK